MIWDSRSFCVAVQTPAYPSASPSSLPRSCGQDDSRSQRMNRCASAEDGTRG